MKIPLPHLRSENVALGAIQTHYSTTPPSHAPLLPTQTNPQSRSHPHRGSANVRSNPPRHPSAHLAPMFFLIAWSGSYPGRVRCTCQTQRCGRSEACRKRAPLPRAAKQIGECGRMQRVECGRAGMGNGEWGERKFFAYPGGWGGDAREGETNGALVGCWWDGSIYRCAVLSYVCISARWAVRCDLFDATSAFCLPLPCGAGSGSCISRFAVHPSLHTEYTHTYR